MSINNQAEKPKNISLSQLVQNAVFEKIEDEYDLQVYQEAIKEYNTNPKTYTHEEVCKILAIDK